MKIISPRLHGVLDYLTVLTCLLAPSLFEFSRTPATISYALGVSYLLTSLLTDYPLAAMRVIPFSIHGLVELVSAPVLFITIVVWALTDFKRVVLTRHTQAV